MTKTICTTCAISFALTLRQLIGYAIQPFTPEHMCWCGQGVDPWWEFEERQSQEYQD